MLAHTKRSILHMSECVVVPAMNQQSRVSGHLICTTVELNWILNNIGQTKREWKRERIIEQESVTKGVI